MVYSHRRHGMLYFSSCSHAISRRDRAPLDFHNRNQITRASHKYINSIRGEDSVIAETTDNKRPTTMTIRMTPVAETWQHTKARAAEKKKKFAFINYVFFSFDSTVPGQSLLCSHFHNGRLTGGDSLHIVMSWPHRHIVVVSPTPPRLNS